MAADEPGSARQSELLTNLFQLRNSSDTKPSTLHSFRIVADVFDEDCKNGVLVLRDSSATEFLQLDLQGQKIEAGATICLEGKGCALTQRGFGLVITPKMVVNNDGIHGRKSESGSVFLRAGLNPITLEWFNDTGDLFLTAEYEGPGVPRQRIPSSILSKARIDRATGRTNFSAGLDFRVFEGTQEFLPDFLNYSPAKTGSSTNFDVNVRTRNDNVGLEFSGFINISRDGVYTFHLGSDDGSRLFIGEASVGVRVLAQNPAPAAAEKLPSSALERNSHPWVTVQGTVIYAGFWKTGGELQLQIGNDNLRVEVFGRGDSVPEIPAHGRVRVSGVYQDVVTEDSSHDPGLLLVSSWKSVRPVALSETNSAKSVSSGKTTNLPPVGEPGVITTAAEIKALPPNLVRQQPRVSIRGVVTAFRSSYSGGVVQDSTRGIFVDLHNLPEIEPLQRGELCQIDGVAGPGFFAPVVVAQRIMHLGPAKLPEPTQATFEQLVNGSLDTEYVEISGVVTKIQNQRVVLLTEGGKITLELSDFLPENLIGYENAFVKIRGCIFVNFNLVTRKLEAGSFLMSGTTVHVLRPAPSDLFQAPQKGIGELLLYDPKAAPFRLLKVTGQVIYAQAGKYFLTDGTNGIQVTTGSANEFSVGDVAEAVGFLDLAGPVTELKEAVMRQTGSAPLAAPRELAPDRLLPNNYAGTLVRVNATLMNHWWDGAEQVLALQSGYIAFRARINTKGSFILLPSTGSKLELTGVYAPHNRGPIDGSINGFDLLLPSATSFRVLANPPWWTLKRVLVLAGLLAALLCAALVWNKELQRKVQERGRQLEAEIHKRQRAELQQAAEAERARIARDLHDELGAGLTEVSLLASADLYELRSGEKNNDRFGVIAEKARDLVSALDVIVWAIDPKHNFLQSFADYLESYTKEFLSSSGIGCRFKIPIECAAITLPGPARHSLFLAVKEVLNNVIRHSAATEVELEISPFENGLQITIADNGRGFDWDTIRRGNGLENLRARMEALHGQCEIDSKPQKGTTIKLVVPVTHRA